MAQRQWLYTQMFGLGQKDEQRGKEQDLGRLFAVEVVVLDSKPGLKMEAIHVYLSTSLECHPDGEIPSSWQDLQSHQRS